jgi:hypothetical protein
MNTGPGILNDGEDEMPVGSAISRWARRAFKAEAQIDRLHDELARLNKLIIDWREDQRQRIAKTDKFGLALMMIREGCADPREVARAALVKAEESA